MIDRLEKPYDRSNKLKFLIGIVTCFVILDLMVREQLFKASLPILINLREFHQFKRLDQFFELIQWIGDKNAIPIYLHIAYHLMDLPKSFTLALCTYSGIALLCLLKSVNHEARPFHVTSDLHPEHCRLEFGNPSGHALLTTSMYLTFWKLMCFQMKYQYGTVKHFFSLLLVMAMIGLVGFTRIYHGVHTIN